ncbi:MAG: DUF4912 domain-containing protein [Bacillota bacterium]
MTKKELAQKPKAELLKMPEAKSLRGKATMSKTELVEAIWKRIDEKRHLAKISQKAAEETRNITSSPQIWDGKIEGVRFQAEIRNWPDFEVPDKYDETKLVIMARDPYWIFSYWEISRHDQQELIRKYGAWYNRPLIMRVYDITDIHFNGYNAHRFFDVQLNYQTNSWYIHVGEPDRSYCCEIGFLSDQNAFVAIARSNTVNTPRDRISHMIDEEWMVVEEDFQKLFRLAGGMQIGQSSLEMMERFKKRLESEISSGAISSISSPAKLVERERKFWLVVHTELIVYGATEPDAAVTIQGKPVELRDDGTFSVRFALPDGQQYIPVSATSADDIDRITITPHITKTTS